MKILRFDVKNGIYEFEMTSFVSGFHAHPAMEVILAQDGVFSIATATATYPDLRLAILPPNLPHRFSQETGRVRLLMLESIPFALGELSNGFSLDNSSGNILAVSDHLSGPEVYPTILHRFQQSPPTTKIDNRIQDCLTFIDGTEVAYQDLLPSLCSVSHLSGSRLSHLFRREMGLSPKKYYVWVKLRRAIKRLLEEDITLSEAGLKAGFYDQAHLSKAFKQHLGVAPSLAYNSRTLQG